MKKLFALLIALIMVLSLAACDLGNDNPGNTNNPGNTDNPGTSEPDNSGEEVVGWDDAAVQEDLRDYFAVLTNSVPEPQSAYTINAVSNPSTTGLMFDFEDEAAAQAWVETLISDGFEQVDERFGVLYYGNGTHTVKVSGYSITITTED